MLHFVNRRFSSLSVLLLCISWVWTATSIASTDFNFNSNSTLQGLLLSDEKGHLSPTLIGTGFYLSNGPNIETEVNALIARQSLELVCQFPARYSFLADLDLLDDPIDLSQCSELQQMLSDLLVDEVWLVVASPSVTSPMSYFGHIALVFKKPDDLYFSRAISFLAKSENYGSELSLMIRGALSSIQGVYAVNSFHQLINKYSEIDQRIMTAHRLVLSESEIRRLALHLVEVQQYTFDYNFFQNNCSTGIRGLLEVAIGEIDNAEVFGRFTSPNTLVSALYAEEKIDFSFQFDPSLVAIYEQYWKLNSAERRRVRQIMREDTALELTQLTDDEMSHRIRWIIQNIYRIRFKAYGKPPSDYGSVMVQSVDWGMEPYRKVSYLQKPERYFGLAYDLSRSSNWVLSLSPGLLDTRHPIQTGAVRQTFRFLSTDIRIGFDEVQIDELKILELDYFNQRNVIWSPWSWQFQFGATRTTAQDKLLPYGMYRAGGSWGDPDTLVALMGGVYIYGDQFSPSITSTVERTWRNTSVKAEYSYFFLDPLSRLKSGLKIDITQSLSIRSAILFSYDMTAGHTLLGLRRGF